MTTNKSKAAMRYAARLCCIYDWTQGSMERTAEDFSREACLESISALNSFIMYNEGKMVEVIEKLWSIVGDLFPGIGNKDIEDADRWVIPELVKVYGQQKREINAVQRLREVFYAEGITLMDLQNQTGEPYVSFMRWTRFQTHIPDIVVQAVENLDATKTTWKTSEVFVEKNRIRREYADAARAKKS